MVNENEYLSHHGIKGQKWGVRRYQNKDNTLTDAGKKRYAREAKDNNWEIGADGIARSTSKKTKGEVHKANPDKWVTEDMTRTKKVADSSATMARQLNEANTKAIKNKPRSQMDLSNMTDQEMRAEINRVMLERQYNDVFNPPTVSKGREYAGKILESAGTALTLTGSALSIALAIRELRGH